MPGITCKEPECAATCGLVLDLKNQIEDLKMILRSLEPELPPEPLKQDVSQQKARKVVTSNNLKVLKRK